MSLFIALTLVQPCQPRSIITKVVLLYRQLSDGQRAADKKSLGSEWKSFDQTLLPPGSFADVGVGATCLKYHSFTFSMDQFVSVDLW